MGSRIRLLALDVDGTLLDGSGRIRPRTVAALTSAARLGVRTVLCTGRRYRRARPVAAELGLDAPIVCNSGALVKIPSDHRTLRRFDLDPTTVRLVLEVFRREGRPGIAWTDLDPSEPDLVASAYPSGHEAFDEYIAFNRSHARVEPEWLNRPGAHPWFHVAAIGSRAEMLAFEAAIHAALGGRARTFVQKSPRYRGFMCEILDAHASKWTAVLAVASQWGIPRESICAVGDDRNDVPMLEGAGLGVAMGQAPEEVRAAADLVTGDHDADGLAEVIERVVANERCVVGTGSGGDRRDPGRELVVPPAADTPSVAPERPIA